MFAEAYSKDSCLSYYLALLELPSQDPKNGVLNKTRYN